MRRVIAYSVLLIAGLVLSQVLPAAVGAGYGTFAHALKLLTMLGLAFIMIHVGYEFDIDQRNVRQYGWDYVVAATAAGFPWLFCAVYFVLLLAPPGSAGRWDAWQESLLAARFAAPTSAGVLFSMLAAAGLATTWVYRKTRVLAIFDDLDTVLLMIPLKMLMVGFRWQLGVIVIVMAGLLWLAWRGLHRVRIPVTWPWVLGYAAAITLACEGIYLASRLVDEVVPVHIEVLLPAFVLGCMIARPRGPAAGRADVLETPGEQRVAAVVSGVFMVLVGLSMPALTGAAGPDFAAADREAAAAHVVAGPAATAAPAGPAESPGWGVLAVHVLLVTLLSNVGKMYPALCYRRAAPWRDRLAVAIAMFPRGEVGAGVLIVSLSYGIGGPMITVAMFSLALNLLLTGLFIVVVRKLIGPAPAGGAARGQAADDPAPFPLAEGAGGR